MNRLNLLLPALVLLFSVASPSCKKSGSDDDDGQTTITTIELSYEPPSTPILGNAYSFKLRFDEIGTGDKSVTEYGVVYKAWIGDKTDKNPTVGESESTKVIFGNSANATGVPETKKVDLTYQNFNDANYRAYAILEDGSVVYGSILHIGFD